MTFINPQDPQSPFWLLLRAGLWCDGSILNDFKPIEDKAWSEILRTASATGTSLIFADALELLPENLRPSKDLQKRLVFGKVTNLNSHAKHNKVISELFKLFEEHDIKAVLLKGQQLAQNYCCPESRACGDIDVFVGEEQIPRIVKLLKDLGYTYEEEINDNDKHVVLYFNGLQIELHRFALFLPQRRKNALFQKWWNENVFQQLVPCTIDENGKWQKGTEAAGQIVTIPDATMNVFFTFGHIFKHFINEMQFRQLLDLARLLYAQRGTYDANLLQEKIEQYGLALPWQVIGTYLHKYIGLPIEYIPFYSEAPADKLEKFEKRINNRFFNPAFRSRKRPEGFIAGKLHSYIGHFANAKETLSLFPALTIANLWDLTVRGIALLFNKDNRPTGTSDQYIKRTSQSN